MRYSYTRWDGTQEISPLDADEILDLIADDMLEEGDLRRALDRLMLRGGNRPQGDRLQGLRDLLERLRNQRQEQLSRYNLDNFMEDIGERQLHATRVSHPSDNLHRGQRVPAGIEEVLLAAEPIEVGFGMWLRMSLSSSA